MRNTFIQHGERAIEFQRHDGVDFVSSRPVGTRTTIFHSLPEMCEYFRYSEKNVRICGLHGGCNSSEGFCALTTSHGHASPRFAHRYWYLAHQCKRREDFLTIVVSKVRLICTAIFLAPDHDEDGFCLQLGQW